MSKIEFKPNPAFEILCCMYLSASFLAAACCGVVLIARMLGIGTEEKGVSYGR
jgi:hypothetical protein